MAAISAAAQNDRDRAGRRAVLGALLLSLAAHGLAVTFIVKSWRDARPAATVGRQQGAMQVALRREAAPPSKVTAATPDRPTTAATPRKQRPRAAKPAAAPRPAPSPSPAPAPPQEAARPGARFASLFAPIVHSPLGRGGWASPKPAPAPPPPSPELQRAQARLALRVALQTRLASLAEQLRTAQMQLACQLQIDPEQRIGQLECEDARQQTLAWGHLQGLLTAGVVTEHTERLCLHLAHLQVQDTACPTPLTP